MFNRTKKTGDQIPARHTEDIFNHVIQEIGELAVEISASYDPNSRKTVGDDGVTGEGIDVIIAVLDLIQTDNPSLTKDEYVTIFEAKLEKWLTKYGN